MGLEAPLALLGLLGIAIPLLLHRMRKRELPRVVLPTFALLSRAVARSQQKHAFTDIWLLLVRIALVAAAAFALAVPYVAKHLSFGDGRLASVVVVIDDSLSMARLDAGTSLISRARARAIEVVQALPEGSEVAVILAGKPARVWIPMGRDLANAQRTLAEAELAAARENDLDQALELALRQQTRGLVTPQRVLVLSDFARHAVLDPKKLPADASVHYEPIGTPTAKANLYIASTHSGPDAALPSQTAIAVEISTAGPEQSIPTAARVEVEVQGKVLDSQAIALERGAARALLHVPTAQPSQTVEARVRIVADDGLAADNQVSLVLGHADALQVLMVNGDPRPATRIDELFYAGRALSLLSDGQLPMRVQTVDPLSFEHAELTDIDVVFMANVAAPDAALAQRLSQYVRDGGGLIIAAGSRLDPALYNARLEGILPAHLRGTANCEALRFTAPQPPRSLSEGLSGLHEVRSQQRLLLDLLPSAETSLSFEDGAPALAARSEGDGRTLLLATTLDTDFSDLPLRPGYLPLLAAMLRDAAGPTAAARGKIAPGEKVVLPSPKAGRYLEVRGPTGRTWRFPSAAGAARISFADTDALGLYSIYAGRADGSAQARLRATFVVTPPRSEADVSAGPVPDSDESGRAKTAPPVEVHVPCSPWLWVLVFALVVGDGLLRARRRWGEHLAQ